MEFNTNKYLTDLCKCHPHARLDTIRHILYELEVNDSFIIDEEFNSDIDRNMVLHPVDYNKTKKTILFVAHYDVFNENSDNCCDNTASVINLIHMLYMLKELTVANNVFVALSDNEERGATGIYTLMNGLRIDGHDIDFAINLELTAFGHILLLEKVFNRNIDEKKIDNLTDDICKLAKERQVTHMPPSDAFVIRLFGVPCITLSLIDKYGEDRKRWLWSKIIHSTDDSIDLADIQDMDNFVNNILFPICNF